MAFLRKMLPFFPVLLLLCVFYSCFETTANAGAELPDLSVILNAPLGKLSPDVSFSLSATILNYGETEADASQLRFYLSSSDILEPETDILIESFETPAIAAASSDEILFSYSLSTGGTWYFFAVSDAENIIAEFDETNNQCCKAVVIDPEGTKDLKPESAGFETDPLYDGGSFILTVPIINNGTNTITENFSAEFYLSTDTDFTVSGDILIGETEIDHDFPQYSSWFLHALVTIPDDLNLDQLVYVYCILDTGFDVPESDETNNTSDIAKAAVVNVYDDDL